MIRKLLGLFSNKEQVIVITFKGEARERFLSLANSAGNSPDEVVRDAMRLYEYLVQKHLNGTRFFEQEIGHGIMPVEFFGEEKLGSGKIVCITDKK